MKEEHARVAESNRQFSELNSKFREIYKEVENLEALKSKTQHDLDEARESLLHELPGAYFFDNRCSNSHDSSRHR